MERRYSYITGTGSYIPKRRILNKEFHSNTFYSKKGAPIAKPPLEITEKFAAITTIVERRYVEDHVVTSDIAFWAAERAIEDAGIDQETLDYIIVAHNFGDVKYDNPRSDMVPSLAARVKHKLGIVSPHAIAYDLPFGCPGWLQGVIQADYFIRSGDARRILIIGAEVLSRVCDPHDRDSMLYADGAGAIILEARESITPQGVLAHQTRSDTIMHSQMLRMDTSYKSNGTTRGPIYLKMNGRKLYQYALEHVPQAIKDCLIKSGVCHKEIKKILIHQANGKMDAAILSRFYDLFEDTEIPAEVMPMTVDKLGNSSVATIPTLLDLICHQQLPPHEISEGDILVFASVGAGMNINAMIYRA